MTRARQLSRLINPTNFTVDVPNSRVGLGSENPTAKLNVAGIVSATAFYGDGSNLDGVASAGLGTAVDDTSLYGGNVIYYTNKVLSIGGTVTVDPPSSANVAYTQYQEISVESGADFIVADGDDFIPDILGISSDVQSPGLLPGAGGRVRTGSITNKAGTGAPQLTFGAEVPVGYGITGAGGINITGVATAASFSGNLTGNVTGNVTGNADTATTATTATNAQGLTGTPDITVGSIVGSALTISGISTLTDLRLASIADKTTIVDGNTVSLSYSSGGGNVAICTNPSGAITLNVTNIPTTSDFDNRAISFAIIVQQGATAYACTSVTLNGVAFGANATTGVQTHIAYSGGTVAVGNTSSYDTFNFTGINTVGSASTTTNYKLLSNINGDYRLY